MPVFRECGNYEDCLKYKGCKPESLEPGEKINCEGCHTYGIYRKGFEDGVKALARKLNRMAEEEGGRLGERN